MILHFGVPPTPTPTIARSDANVMKLGEPPAARPKMPASNRVALKHHLLTKQVRKSFLHPMIRHHVEPSSPNIATKTPEHGTNK